MSDYPTAAQLAERERWLQNLDESKFGSCWGAEKYEWYNNAPLPYSAGPSKVPSTSARSSEAPSTMSGVLARVEVLEAKVADLTSQLNGKQDRLKWGL